MGYGNGEAARQQYAAMLNVPQGVGSAPAPMIGITHVIEEQGQILTSLYEVLSDLEKRLTLLLAPAPPSTADAAKSPQSPQIVSRLMDHNHGINAARQIVVGLIERLQL